METVELSAIKAGDTWLQDEVTYQTNSGDPISLAGATIRFQVRDRPGGCLLIGLSSDKPEEIEITDAAAGKFVRKTRRAEIRPGYHFWEYEITLADGTRQSYPEAGAEGRWRVESQVTV